MKFVSRYQAKKPDVDGIVEYASEEHAIWNFLFRRQEQILPKRAVSEFIQGLNLLDLRREAIPQIPELNERMAKYSD